jgi:cytochrome c biogenesis protein CcdA
MFVAFLGGAIMLFAPCCITLMLPAYLGTVFKSRSKIVLMTSIFALGVATIILPVVLGAQFLTSFFSAYHAYVFAVGSLLMIGIGVMTLYGKKIPMPFVGKLKSPQVTNATSAYALGVVSGVSSACCAPVLLGALSLAAISPTLLQAGAIGLAYTFGIVFPLFLLGIFYKRGLWKRSQKLQQKRVHLRNMTIPLSNFLSFLVFTIAGLFFLTLALLNGNQVNAFNSNLIVTLKSWTNTAAKPINAIPGGQIIFGLILLGILIYLIHLARQELKEPDNTGKDGKK